MRRGNFFDRKVTVESPRLDARWFCVSTAYPAILHRRLWAGRLIPETIVDQRHRSPRRPDNFAHRRLIVILQPAPQRVRHQLFSIKKVERIGFAQVPALLSSGESWSIFWLPAGAVGSTGLPASSMVVPSADDVGISGENPRIDHRMAAVARMICAMLGGFSRVCSGMVPGLFWSVGTLVAGRNGRAEDIIEQPFAASARARLQ